MNYLAHLFLAEPTPEALIGNLLGDFQRGLDRRECSEGMLQGIWLHTQIDHFTDHHPLVKRSRDRIQGPYRRFAGVMLDVLYDHYLSKHWQCYAQQPLEEFIRQVYGLLQANHNLLPPQLQQAVPSIIAHNLLGSYGQLQGVERALQRMSRRIKRQNALGQSTVELQRNYTCLEADFLAFFPELMQFVEQVSDRSFSLKFPR